MRVRAATLADLPMLAEMVITAAQEVGRPETAETVMQYVGIALHDGQLVPVLENGGRDLVGFCAWVRLPTSSDGRVEGCGTWVAEPYRLRGWSEKLRNEALMYQRTHGGRYVIGEADANDIAACRSVEKLGFRPDRIVYRLEVR